LRGRNIVFVLESFEMGGAEKQAVLLARMLRDRAGANVHVVGLRPGPLEALLAQEGIPAVGVANSGGRLQRGRSILRTLRKLQPDVLLPYTTFPNVVCGILWRATGARASIWSQRDPGVHRPAGRIGAIAEKTAVRLTPAFVSNSKHGAEFLERKLGVASSTITVVPNAIVSAKPSRARPTTRNDLGIADSAFVAVMTAHFAPEKKDHLTLLDAWKQALPRMSGAGGGGAVLLLAGRHDRGYAPAAARAKELGISDSVRFMGEVRDISSLLAAADVGVLSSRNEGLPNAIMEYMAAGLPVVATRIPGIDELVFNCADAILVEPGDASQLADALAMIASESTQARAQRGTNLRLLVESRFGADALYNAMHAVIQENIG
jgi:glycosyltransferase involved in cell wall biosynthesis